MQAWVGTTNACHAINTVSEASMHCSGSVSVQLSAASRTSHGLESQDAVAGLQTYQSAKEAVDSRVRSQGRGSRRRLRVQCSSLPGRRSEQGLGNGKSFPSHVQRSTSVAREADALSSPDALGVNDTLREICSLIDKLAKLQSSVPAAQSSKNQSSGTSSDRETAAITSSLQRLQSRALLLMQHIQRHYGTHSNKTVPSQLAASFREMQVEYSVLERKVEVADNNRSRVAHAQGGGSVASSIPVPQARPSSFMHDYRAGVAQVFNEVVFSGDVSTVGQDSVFGGATSSEAWTPAKDHAAAAADLQGQRQQQQHSSPSSYQDTWQQQDSNGKPEKILKEKDAEITKLRREMVALRQALVSAEGDIQTLRSKLPTRVPLHVHQDTLAKLEAALKKEEEWSEALASAGREAVNAMEREKEELRRAMQIMEEETTTTLMRLEASLQRERERADLWEQSVRSLEREHIIARSELESRELEVAAFSRELEMIREAVKGWEAQKREEQQQQQQPAIAAGAELQGVATGADELVKMGRDVSALRAALREQQECAAAEARKSRSLRDEVVGKERQVASLGAELALLRETVGRAEGETAVESARSEQLRSVLEKKEVEMQALGAQLAAAEEALREAELRQTESDGGVTDSQEQMAALLARVEQLEREKVAEKERAEAELSQKQEQLDVLSMDMAALQAAVAEQLRVSAGLESEQAEATARLEALLQMKQREEEERRVEVQNLRRALIERQTLVGDAEEEKRRVEEQLQAKVLRVVTLEEEVAELTARSGTVVLNLSSSLAEEARDEEVERTKMLALLQEKDREVEALALEVAALQLTLQEGEVARGELRAGQVAEEEETRVLEAELKRQELELEEKEQVLTELQGHVASLQHLLAVAVATHVEERASGEAIVADMRRSLREKGALLEAAQEEAGSLQSSLMDMERVIDSLLAQENTLRREVDEKRERLTLVAEEEKRLRQLYVEREGQLAELQAQLEVSRLEVPQVELALAAMRKERDEALAAAEEVKTLMAKEVSLLEGQLTEERDRMEVQVASTEVALEEMQRALAQEADAIELVSRRETMMREEETRWAAASAAAAQAMEKLMAEREELQSQLSQKEEEMAGLEHDFAQERQRNRLMMQEKAEQLNSEREQLQEAFKEYAEGAAKVVEEMQEQLEEEKKRSAMELQRLGEEESSKRLALEARVAEVARALAAEEERSAALHASSEDAMRALAVASDDLRVALSEKQYVAVEKSKVEAELRSSLQKSRAEVEGITRARDEVAAELQSRMAAFESSMASFRAEVEAERRSTEASAASLAGVIVTLRKEIEHLNTSINEKEESYEAELQDLIGQLDEARTRCILLSSEIREKDGIVTTLRTEADQLAFQVKEMTGSFVGKVSQKEMRKLKAEVQTAQQRLESLQKDRIGDKAQLLVAEAKARTVERELEKTDAMLEDARNGRQRMEEELLEAVEQKAALEARVLELESQLRNPNTVLTLAPSAFSGAAQAGSRRSMGSLGDALAERLRRLRKISAGAVEAALSSGIAVEEATEEEELLQEEEEEEELLVRGSFVEDGEEEEEDDDVAEEAEEMTEALLAETDEELEEEEEVYEEEEEAQQSHDAAAVVAQTGVPSVLPPGLSLTVSVAKSGSGLLNTAAGAVAPQSPKSLDLECELPKLIDDFGRERVRGGLGLTADDSANLSERVMVKADSSVHGSQGGSSDSGDSNSGAKSGGMAAPSRGGRWNLKKIGGKWGAGRGKWARKSSVGEPGGALGGHGGSSGAMLGIGTLGWSVLPVESAAPAGFSAVVRGGGEGVSAVRALAFSAREALFLCDNSAAVTGLGSSTSSPASSPSSGWEDALPWSAAQQNKWQQQQGEEEEGAGGAEGGLWAEMGMLDNGMALEEEVELWLHDWDSVVVSPAVGAPPLPLPKGSRSGRREGGEGEQQSSAVGHSQQPLSSQQTQQRSGEHCHAVAAHPPLEVSSSMSTMMQQQPTVAIADPSPSPPLSPPGAMAQRFSMAISLEYETGWKAAYIHYCISGNKWTQPPGKLMEDGELGTSGRKVKTVSLPVSCVEFVVTDGQGNWDRSPSGANYKIEGGGKYLLCRGQITRLAS